MTERTTTPEKINALRNDITLAEEEIAALLDALALDEEAFYQCYFEQERVEVSTGYGWLGNTVLYLIDRNEQSGRRTEQVKQGKNQFTRQIEQEDLTIVALRQQIEVLKQRFKEIPFSTDKLIKLIRINTQRLTELDKLRLSPIAEIKTAPKSSQSPHHNAHAKKNGIGGADLLNMEFETFQLVGEMGRFLGELDRNMTAFALTGDSGAGKSYFSFEMARAFVEYGFKAKYFSLEEGLGKLTQDKVRKYNIGNDMTITGYSSLRDIRKDAKHFDLIVIDSFQKLGVKPEEFERLRNDFPKTIFIIIFQKTTAGTIRGGSSIKFNSSAAIDVVVRDGERIAVMDKGRYGTMGWEYSITDGVVVKE
ncbi:MAG: ATP-binding protein [Flavobacteriales bacterium]|nr:ATP-binding protein [Flavobacteriales bacterium]